VTESAVSSQMNDSKATGQSISELSELVKDVSSTIGNVATSAPACVKTVVHILL